MAFLSPGSKVAFAAPSRFTTPDEVAPAVALLKQWGLQPVVPDGLYERYNQFAGTDQHRAHLLQRLLDDDTIRAIICVRGGYGAARIVDSLRLDRFAASPKVIIGYSDITVLHARLYGACHCQSLHATMPVNITSADLDSPSPAVVSLRQALMGEQQQCFTFPAHPLNRLGSASGPLVGGNLSILYSMQSTPSALNADGCILFIEDLDEYLYHIDRMMQNLRRSGTLRNIAALLVGGLTDMHDNSVPFGSSAQQIVLDAVSAYSYPVIFNAPFGHLGGQNLAFWHGARYTLQATASQSKLFM